MHHSLKKEKLAIRIAFMISAGFIAQWIMILDMKQKYGAQYISMFDWYILNYSAANLIPNFMIWGIPLLCGLLNSVFSECGWMSLYYDEVRRSIDGSGCINSFFQSRVFSGLFQSSFYLYQLLCGSDLYLQYCILSLRVSNLDLFF